MHWPERRVSSAVKMVYQIFTWVMAATSAV